MKLSQEQENLLKFVPSVEVRKMIRSRIKTLLKDIKKTHNLSNELGWKWRMERDRKRAKEELNQIAIQLFNNRSIQQTNNPPNGFGDRDGYYESGNDIDVIIIEGWLIGYEPHNFTSDDLYLFNENLKLYKNLKNNIDFWVKVESNDIKNIYGWRWSAEDKENGMDKK